MQINKKNIGICIVLSIVTFGIYYIYWMYLMVKNIRILTNDTGRSCLGEMLCLLFVPFYSYYWWYTRGEKVKSEFAAQNRNCTGSGVIYLLLAIFGLAFVGAAIMQNDFNSYE